MDPREQLIKTGAELLDAVYLCQKEAPIRTRLQKMSPASQEATEAIEEVGGITAVLDMLTHLYDRDRLVKEYVMLRSTIEAMETSLSNKEPWHIDLTTDIVPGIHNPERNTDA